MTTQPPPRSVGFVGAGQLARMAGEAASALGLSFVVLAEHPNDAAVGVATEVLIGSPQVAADLDALAERCEVITFDHELVDLDVIVALEGKGQLVRPGSTTLAVAIDKATMRQRFHDSRIAVPAFRVLTTDQAVDEIATFSETSGWPLVVKASRGGYDGRGVWPVQNLDEAALVVEAANARGVPLLVEAMVHFDAELAIQVARRPGGEMVTWPAVETAQIDGVCREVLVPGEIAPDVLAAADALARQVADSVDLVGVLAVELFLIDGHLLVNEVAAQPHNSGHWTIEGSVTSQFENHLRAVLDLPLGSTTTSAPSVASVNVFGDDDGRDPVTLLDQGLAVPGASIHLYGKEPRKGRKLGHVTVCGTDPMDVRRRAWASASALGTPRPAGLSLPEGAP